MDLPHHSALRRSRIGLSLSLDLARRPARGIESPPHPVQMTARSLWRTYALGVNRPDDNSRQAWRCNIPDRIRCREANGRRYPLCVRVRVRVRVAPCSRAPEQRKARPFPTGPTPSLSGSVSRLDLRQAVPRPHSRLAGTASRSGPADPITRSTSPGPRCASASTQRTSKLMRSVEPATDQVSSPSPTRMS